MRIVPLAQTPDTSAVLTTLVLAAVTEDRDLIIEDFTTNWGATGDLGLVAYLDDAATDASNQVAGAAWVRNLGEAGRGWVADAIPQLYVVVAPDHQGAGLATGLVTGLLQLLQLEHIDGVSALIPHTSSAEALFAHLGFVEVGQTHAGTLVLKNLT